MYRDNLYTPAPNTKSIDLTQWGFADGGAPVSAAEITDILGQEFVNQPPEMSFPYVWSLGNTDGRSGPPVTDPLAVYLSVPLGPTDGESPEWQCSLRDVLLDECSMFEERDGRILGPNGPAIVSDIADALERLAGELRAKIPAKTPHTPDRAANPSATAPR